MSEQQQQRQFYDQLTGYVQQVIHEPPHEDRGVILHSLISELNMHIGVQQSVRKLAEDFVGGVAFDSMLAMFTGYLCAQFMVFDGALMFSRCEDEISWAMMHGHLSPLHDWNVGQQGNSDRTITTLWRLYGVPVWHGFESIDAAITGDCKPIDLRPLWTWNELTKLFNNALRWYRRRSDVSNQMQDPPRQLPWRLKGMRFAQTTPRLTNDCPVCLESMYYGHMLEQCGHVLCDTCARAIFSMQARTLKCPMCRRMCQDGVVVTVMRQIAPELPSKPWKEPPSNPWNPWKGIESPYAAAFGLRRELVNLATTAATKTLVFIGLLWDRSPRSVECVDINVQNVQEEENKDQCFCILMDASCDSVQTIGFIVGTVVVIDCDVSLWKTKMKLALLTHFPDHMYYRTKQPGGLLHVAKRLLLDSTIDDQQTCKIMMFI